MGHVELKGLSFRTVHSYVCLVRQLGEWAGLAPSSLDEKRVSDFFLHLKRDRGYAPQSMRQARTSLKSLYAETLGRSD